MSQDHVYKFFNTTQNYLHKNFGVRIRALIIHDLIGVVSQKSLLDIGCGDGGITIQFVKQNAVDFLDISENMLSLVKNRVSVEQATANYFHLDFMSLQPEKKYDLIIAIGFLAHADRVKDALQKMISSLSQDGAIVTQFSDYNKLLTKINIANSGHYRYKLNKLRYQEMLELVRSLGLSVEKEVKFSFMFPGFGKLPNNWLYFINRTIYTTKLGRFIGTDVIWKLKRN